VTNWPRLVRRATLCDTVHSLLRSLTSIVPLAVLGLVGLPSMASGGEASPNPGQGEAPKTVYTVAAIGDSLTDTRVGGGRYMGWLKQRCPESRFDAYGVGGQRTDHLRWRLASDIFGEGLRAPSARPRYSHLIVLGGVNDLVASPPGYGNTDSIRRNLAFIWGAARSRGMVVIALSVPPWTAPGPRHDERIPATARLNSWMSEQQRLGSVDYVVDSHVRLAGEDGVSLLRAYRRESTDFIHWNAVGHEVIAEALFQEVFSDCR